ncbi:hypothetical protein ACXDJA_000073 [Klebsiella variicola]
MSEISFELNDGAFWLSIVMGGIGVAVLFGIYMFGKEMYTKIILDLFSRIQGLIHHNTISNDTSSSYELKVMADLFTKHCERRNEFWTIYGQIVIAIFIALILTVLLITKTISAEAGLPILSAISGFAIAKNSGSGKKSTSLPPNGE